jgi:hypothetical protein
VPAPAVGLYWTPGYWGFAGAGYLWYPGYWGPTVGFYGGINYGFGYFGVGYVGGFWAGSTFAYNGAVTNVNTTVVKNVYYNGTVIHHGTVGGVTGTTGGAAARRGTAAGSRVSFNGGHGGTTAKPTAAQHVAASQRRFGATPTQVKHAAAAGANRNNLVAFNHGKPPVTSTRRPIASASRQPGFRSLSTHDQVAAQTNALSHMRVMGTPVNAAHQSVAMGTGHAASQTHVSNGWTGSHYSGSRYSGSHYSGLQYGYGSHAAYGSRYDSGFYRNAGAWRGFNASRAGFGGPQTAGYRGMQPQGYRGMQPQGFRGMQPQGFRGPQAQGFGPQRGASGRVGAPQLGGGRTGGHGPP